MSQVTSPCIQVCRLERIAGAELCVGCLRSRAELTAWGSWTEAERQQAMRRLEQRAADLLAAKLWQQAPTPLSSQ